MHYTAHKYNIWYLQRYVIMKRKKKHMVSKRCGGKNKIDKNCILLEFDYDAFLINITLKSSTTSKIYVDAPAQKTKHNYRMHAISVSACVSCTNVSVYRMT